MYNVFVPVAAQMAGCVLLNVVFTDWYCQIRLKFWRRLEYLFDHLEQIAYTMGIHVDWKLCWPQRCSIRKISLVGLFNYM